MISKYLVILVLSALSLSACIEVKDTKSEDNQPTQELSVKSSYSDLVVDAPLFLFRGRVLTFEEYNEALQVEGDSSLEQITPYYFNHIRFTKEGALYSMGKTVVIKANSIFSDNGEISTFPLDAVAPPQKNGRSGGSIFLRGTSAEGSLRIVLRGESGGAGADTSEYPPEKWYERGEIFEKVCNRADLKFVVPGLKGGSGMKGGDSGTVEIEISVDNKLNLQVSKEPGHGGRGGLGGPGLVFLNYCTGFTESNEPQQGPQGLEGEAGVEQTSCIKSYGEVVCR